MLRGRRHAAPRSLSLSFGTPMDGEGRPSEDKKGGARTRGGRSTYAARLVIEPSDRLNLRDGWSVDLLRFRTRCVPELFLQGAKQG